MLGHHCQITGFKSILDIIIADSLEHCTKWFLVFNILGFSTLYSKFECLNVVEANTAFHPTGVTKCTSQVPKIIALTKFHPSELLVCTCCYHHHHHYHHLSIYMCLFFFIYQIWDIINCCLQMEIATEKLNTNFNCCWILDIKYISFFKF